MYSRATLICSLYFVHHSIIQTASCFDFDKAYTKSLSGGIQGYHKTSENGRKFLAFESIPYALPPTGKLRFEVK